MKNEEAIKEIIKNEDVEFLAKFKFDIILTPGQADIVRRIVFRKNRRISISAMTRYGKSQAVAIAIALLIDLNKNLKVAFIGPKQEQAGILRQYMAELIMKDPDLLSKAQISVEGEGRIMKEASRKRMTFTNGCEYRVFSAEGEAERLMGFGADVVVCDEACLIGRTAYTKILRMLGDSPETSMLIELYNPWERDNVAFEHTLDPNFEVIHIGYGQAIKEGRTTELFVEEQRKALTPIEFTVLYESKFPEESEDSLFNLAKIEIAENQKFNFESELNEIEAKLKESHKYKEIEIKQFKEEVKKYKKIISCDPADKGLDESVFYWGTQKENKYEVNGYYSEPKTESMNLVGRIVEKAENFIGRKVPGVIFIDRIGIGAGPLSRIREVLSEKGYKNIKVIGAHFGEAAVKKDHYQNKKAENYFRLQSIFNDGLISIPIERKLKSQLIAMKWELNSSSKRKIIDPEDKSPDWADALVYFIWRDDKELSFSFI